MTVPPGAAHRKPRPEALGEEPVACPPVLVDLLVEPIRDRCPETAVRNGFDAEEVTDSERQTVRRLERVILELLERRGPEATICPSAAARAMHAQGNDGWRSLMEPARRAARRLARAGMVRSPRGTFRRTEQGPRAHSYPPRLLTHPEGGSRRRPAEITWDTSCGLGR